MRVTRLFALIALPCLLLCGCQRTGEVENQAYVLVLGMDRAEDGLLRLTARIPKVGKSNEPSGEASGGGKYLTFTATGPDWPQARDALERVTPRPLNLSHIEMLVVSRALASEAGFPALAGHVAETPHLYTTACFVVCEGDANAFVSVQEAAVGERLSAELKAMLTHYSDEGYIPDCSLAEYCYATQSFYSDPAAVFARSGNDSQPMRQRYEGAALFREGVCAVILDTDETRLLELILGKSKALPLALDGRTVELTTERRAKRRVTPSGSGDLLEADLSFSTLDNVSVADISTLEDRLRSLIVDLIVKCQRASVEPFGFSERVAAGYATVQEWLASDWRSRYAAADVRVNVHIDRNTAP